jgi:hypothetical protein
MHIRAVSKRLHVPYPYRRLAPSLTPGRLHVPDTMTAGEVLHVSIYHVHSPFPSTRPFQPVGST